MSDTYTKLFSSITESTVWGESYATRIVWVTFLAMSNAQGCVYGSVPGIARRANVTMAEAEAAIGAFLAPDPHSRTKDHGGRRIAEIDGGWCLINHAKYAKIRDASERAEVKRKWDRENRPSGYARSKKSEESPTKVRQSDESPISPPPLSPTLTLEKQDQEHVAERQDAGPVIRSTPAEPALDRSGKPVPSIPLKNGRDHIVQQSEFRQLCDLFPRIDVARELALARRWCEDNPARTKTAKGVGRFLVRWMTTAQNDSDMRARGTGHATGRALSAVERVQQAISRRRAERGEPDESADWRGNVVATQ